MLQNKERNLRIILKCIVKLLLFILIIKPTRCTISQIYFGKELYMFRTDLLSIIRSLNTVFITTCTVWRKRTHVFFSNNCNFVYFQYKKIMSTPKNL